MKRIRHWFVAVVAIAAVGPLCAQEIATTPTQAAHLYESLRRTIDHGADLFNSDGDYAGCYRVFEGALLAVRPLVSANRQKEIDDAVSKAARLARFEDRAYQLRTMLDQIRDDMRTLARKAPHVETKKEEKKLPPTNKTEEKKQAVEEKKGTKKVPEERKLPEGPTKLPPVEPVGPPALPLPEKIGPATAAAKTGNVAGVVTVNGRPLEGGKVQIVADQADFAASVEANGEFRFPMPIPSGRYRVAIVPAQTNAFGQRYRDDVTSGLEIRVRPEKQSIELNIVR